MARKPTKNKNWIAEISKPTKKNVRAWREAYVFYSGAAREMPHYHRLAIALLDQLQKKNKGSNVS